MEIKLNKKLQKKLDDFLDNKENLLKEFSILVGIDELEYTIEELALLEKQVEKLLDNERIAEIYHVYIGEVIINNNKGEWSIGKFKKDLAYLKPIVLKKNEMRLCPIVDWFGLLKKGELKEGISGMVRRVIKYTY